MMRSDCPPTCEAPEYPNWAWRYNRNKHLTKFEPWFTRVERWPPHYRNMGVGDNFRFHALSHSEEKDFTWQPGLSYAPELVEGRQTGFGNSALGLSAGPAPPRFVYPEILPHAVGELLTANRIENLTDGASLFDQSRVPTQEPRRTVEPLNPRQYLEKTLGQRVEFPGTFPHINGQPQQSDVGSVACCGGSTGGARPDPLDYWIDYNRERETRNAIQRNVMPHPYPEYCCEEGWEPEPQPPCQYPLK